MALNVGDQPKVNRSTGAAPGPAKQVTADQTIDNASSGAVEYQAPGETVVEHYNAAVVPTYPTPGPVTMTVGWLADDKPQDDAEPSDGDAEAEAKVVAAPKQRTVRPAKAAAETK